MSVLYVAANTLGFGAGALGGSAIAGTALGLEGACLVATGSNVLTAAAVVVTFSQPCCLPGGGPLAPIAAPKEGKEEEG